MGGHPLRHRDDRRTRPTDLLLAFRLATEIAFATSVAGVAQCDAPFSLALRCYDRFPVPAQQEQALLLSVGTIARLQVDRATSDALLAVLFPTSVVFPLLFK